MSSAGVCEVPITTPNLIFPGRSLRLLPDGANGKPIAALRRLTEPLNVWRVMAASETNPSLVIAPMLAIRPRKESASETAPQELGKDWIYEPKLDGFRCLMHVLDGSVILRSRTGNDITGRFAATPLPDVDGPVAITPS